MAEKVNEKFAARDKKYGITRARLTKGTHTERKAKKKPDLVEDEE